MYGNLSAYVRVFDNIFNTIQSSVLRDTLVIRVFLCLLILIIIIIIMQKYALVYYGKYHVFSYLFIIFVLKKFTDYQ